MWKVLLYSFVFHVSVCQDVTFYELPNQQHYIGKLSNVTECTNIPFNGRNNTPAHHSIDTHGECIVLYQDLDCKGQYLKALPGLAVNNDLSAWNFHRKANSVGPCASLPASEVWLHVRKHGIYKTKPVENMCGCEKLPYFARGDIPQIYIFGVCVRVFLKDDCTGGSKRLVPGDGLSSKTSSSDSKGGQWFTSDSWKGNYLASVSRCDAPPKGCMRLTAAITRMKFLTDVEKLIQSTEGRTVDIVARSKIFNNSSQVQTQTIRHTKSITEEFTLERMKGTSAISKWHVDYTYTASASGGISGVFEAKVQHELSVGGGQETEETVQDSKKNSTKSEKIYTIEKTLSISPCSYAEMGSSINIIDNMRVEFQVEFKLQGTLGESEMSSAELTNVSLAKGMKLEGVVDNVTIRASTTGTMKASIGLDMVFHTSEIKFANCTSKGTQSSNPRCSLFLMSYTLFLFIFALKYEIISNV